MEGTTSLESAAYIGQSKLHARGSGFIVDHRRPGQEPPGGTFRVAFVHGFSFRPEEDLKAIIQEVHEIDTFKTMLTLSGLRAVPRNLVQPAHQKLQPLHLLPLREAHRPTRSQLAQPRR